MKKQGAIFRDPHRQRDDSLNFEEAFPDIDSLQVTVEEEGPGNEGLGTRRFTTRSIREYLNCSNPDCTGRGLSIGQELRQRVHTRQTHHHFERGCEGTTPRGPCSNRFAVDVQLTFR